MADLRLAHDEPFPLEVGRVQEPVVLDAEEDVHLRSLLRRPCDRDVARCMDERRPTIVNGREQDVVAVADAGGHGIEALPWAEGFDRAFEFSGHLRVRRFTGTGGCGHGHGRRRADAGCEEALNGGRHAFGFGIGLQQDSRRTWIRLELDGKGPAPWIWDHSPLRGRPSIFSFAASMASRCFGS